MPSSVRRDGTQIRIYRLIATAVYMAVNVLALASSASALDNDLDFDNTLSDNLPARASLAGPEPGEKGGGGLPFAVLPQVGYGPETGPKLGVKFDGRNLFHGATFLDTNLI